MSCWEDLPFEIKSLIVAKYVENLLIEYDLRRRYRGSVASLVSIMADALTRFLRACPEMRNETIRVMKAVRADQRTQKDRLFSKADETWTYQDIQIFMTYSDTCYFLDWMLSIDNEWMGTARC